MGCSGSVPTEAVPVTSRAVSSSTRRDDPSKDRTSVQKTDVESLTPASFHEKYIVGEKLGKGAFAHVYLAMKASAINAAKDGSLREDGQERQQMKAQAVKVSDLRPHGGQAGDAMDPKACRAAERESIILKKVANVEHCVRIHDVYLEGFLSYIVMERCDMPLIQALDREPTLTEGTFVRYIREMMQAIANIHALRICHRDVKPDNFLCSGPKLMVKLCDFGLAEVVGRTSDSTSLKGVYGTAPFMAPDMLGGGSYGLKVDVWSMGVILYVLMLGHFPYQPTEATTKAMKAAILSGVPEPTFRAKKSAQGNARVSADVKTLMHILLTRAPEERPSAVQALEMPWLCSERQTHEDPTQCSLRPRLVAAKRAGAFDMRKPSSLEHCEVDSIVTNLQSKYHKPEEMSFGKAGAFTQMSTITSNSTRCGTGTVTGESEPSVERSGPRNSNVGSRS